MSWVNPLNSRLYIIGGARLSGAFVTGHWWATFNNVTGEISTWSYSTYTPLSFRALANTWRDDAYVDAQSSV
jgi:hypothetical protein